jgi:hypothetical protein
VYHIPSEDAQVFFLLLLRGRRDDGNMERFEEQAPPGPSVERQQPKLNSLSGIQAETRTDDQRRPARSEPDCNTRPPEHNEPRRITGGRRVRLAPPHLHRRAAFSLFLPPRPFRPAPCRRPTCPPSRSPLLSPRPSLPPLPSSAAFSLPFLAEAATNRSLPSPSRQRDGAATLRPTTKSSQPLRPLLP